MRESIAFENRNISIFFFKFICYLIIIINYFIFLLQLYSKRKKFAKCNLRIFFWLCISESNRIPITVSASALTIRKMFAFNLLSFGLENLLEIRFKISSISLNVIKLGNWRWGLLSVSKLIYLTVDLNTLYFRAKVP